MIFYILLDGICVISTCILTENIYILMRCFHDFQFQKAIKFLSVPEPRQFWEQSPHKLENIIFSFGSKLGWRIPNQSKKKCKIHRWSTPQTKNIFQCDKCILMSSTATSGSGLETSITQLLDCLKVMGKSVNIKVICFNNSVH